MAGGAETASPPQAASPPRDGVDGATDGFCLAFGAWTLLCHGMVFLGGSLRALAAGALALALVGAALLLARRRAPRPRPCAVVWGLGALGALVTLLWIRPDLDDALYVNLAVSAMDAPGQALLRFDGLHGLGLPLHLPVYRLHAFELLAALAGYATGTEAIVWLHLVFPPLAALLAVLAHARLLRILAPERWLAALLVVVAILLLVGGTHRWASNLGFVRLHQGKALLVSVMVPLLAALALEFARAPSAGRLIRLGAAQVASVGLSATALWLAPFVSGVALLAAAPASRRGLAILAAGALPSLSPLGLGLRLRSETAARLPAAPESAPELDGLAHAAHLVLGDGALAVAVGFSLLAAWVFAAPGIPRRFLVLAPAAFGLLLFNPLASPWIAEHVTGASAYWRTFWVLPLPVFLALLLTAPLSPRTASWRPFLRLGATLTLVAGFLLWIPEQRVLSARNGVSFAPFALEVPPGHEAARVLAEAVPSEATVLAPFDVSPWLVTLHGHPRPLAVRGVYLTPYAAELGEENVRRRLDLTHWISTPERYQARSAHFLAELAAFDVEAVCVPMDRAAGRRIGAELRRRGFVRVATPGPWAVWRRSAAERP